jgi:hypothetical protein
MLLTDSFYYLYYYKIDISNIALYLYSIAKVNKNKITIKVYHEDLIHQISDLLKFSDVQFFKNV